MSERRMGERYGAPGKRRWFRAELMLAAELFGSSALADGGPPAAYGILFDPADPSRIVIRSQYWGLFDGHEGTVGWSLLCSQAFGGRATTIQDFPTVIAQGGRILVASAFEGLNMSDDGCNWTKSSAFDDSTQIVAIAPRDAARSGFVTVTARGIDGGTTSQVYLSSDRGDTWRETAGKLLADFSVMSVAVAPSDSNRLYVAGVMVDGGPRMVGASTNAGAAWTMLPLGSTDRYDAKADASLSIVGIDPTHPDILFVRANGHDDSMPPISDELWASSDAGKSWVKAHAPSGDMAGFALSADGKKVFIGGLEEGIKVAALEDAVAGKDGAFRSVFTGKVWGLATNGGKLYAGTDDFAMKPPFMLGVSTDEGATFTPVMNHCQVSFPACAATSSMELLCREQWERVGGYVYHLLSNGCENRTLAGAAGMAGAAGAAGMAGAPAVATGGAPPAVDISRSCDCSLARASSSTPSSTIVLVAATAAAVGLTRGRKRTPGAPP